MAGRADASRDLLLGLYALEAGAIDRAQLVSAVRAWARSPGRTLFEVLAEGGLLDATALARLEDLVRTDLGPLDGGPESSETVAYTGRPPEGEAGAATDDNKGPRYRVLRPHARGGLGEV